MRGIVLSTLLLAMPLRAHAAGGSVPLDSADIDLGNRQSLWHGAKLFVNYCMGCHSAQYMRYNRVGKDLGLSEDDLKQYLIFGDKKVGDTMTIAMRPEDAARWFGTPAPDLSLVARSRGPDWLYTYLRTFYLDPKRPFGVNNLVFKDVAMPHVLWELQGWQRPVYRTVKRADGHEEKVIERLELAVPGKLSPAEYDKAVRDLVAFLTYVGEPARFERRRLGPWVLAYLALLIVVFYVLKKEYWRDVH